MSTANRPTFLRNPFSNRYGADGWLLPRPVSPAPEVLRMEIGPFALVRSYYEDSDGNLVEENDFDEELDMPGVSFDPPLCYNFPNCLLRDFPPQNNGDDAPYPMTAETVLLWKFAPNEEEVNSWPVPDLMLVAKEANSMNVAMRMFLVEHYIRCDMIMRPRFVTFPLKPSQMQYLSYMHEEYSNYRARACAARQHLLTGILFAEVYSRHQRHPEYPRFLVRLAMRVTEVWKRQAQMRLDIQLESPRYAPEPIKDIYERRAFEDAVNWEYEDEMQDIRDQHLTWANEPTARRPDDSQQGSLACHVERYSRSKRRSWLRS